MLTRRAILGFLLLAAAPARLAAQARPGLPAEVVQQIEQAVTAEMSKWRVPAVSVAVATGGELRYSRGFGMSDLENFVPAKAATVYRLGSISKPITAVAAMQLVERGKLDLDAPVQKYVPSFPAKPWPLTSRHLLGHLGGIRHYRGDQEFGSTKTYPNLLETLKIFQDDPLLSEPGTKYSYTTYGFSLLGAVVESASGMRFVDYLKENIFKPAGMSTMGPDEVSRITPNRARGYHRTTAGEIENCGLADTSNKIPGGGLSSSVEDLVKFAIAVQRGVLLRKETVERMFTRQKTRDGQLVNYGLGWFVREQEGRKTVTHGGSQQGTATNLYLSPADGPLVAVMTNLDGWSGPAALTEQIAKVVLR